MRYKSFDNVIAARLEIGDEIVASVREICEKEGVRLAAVHGIGAVRGATIGLFDLSKKKYTENKLDKFMELTSLEGNVTTLNGETYIHLHANFGDETGRAFGGHLKESVVGATAEIFIFRINGEITRFYDENVTTLNIMDI